MKAVPIAFSGLLMAGLLAGCEPAEQAAAPNPGPRPVKVVQVAASDEATAYRYPAMTLAAAEAALSFRVPGQLFELPVRAMDEVKEGDLIARLDSRDFRSTVDQLRSQLAAEQSRLEAMTAGARREDIAASRANVNAAEAEVSRTREQAEQTLTNYRRGVVAKEQFDSAIAALRATEAQLEARRQELSKGQSGSREEEVQSQLSLIANIETQIQSALDTQSDTELRAPFDGTVATRLVDNFANVQPNQTIVSLQNFGTLELLFDVPGPDVARLGPRREQVLIEAELDAAPGRRFPAEVVEFNAVADTATDTFQGRVRIETPEDLVILPGMSGEVVVTDHAIVSERSQPSVPASAVGAQADGTPIVWVLGNDETVSPRIVTLGTASRDSIVITDGVLAGETVVTAGLGHLLPGMKVRPVERIGD